MWDLDRPCHLLYSKSYIHYVTYGLGAGVCYVMYDIGAMMYDAIDFVGPDIYDVINDM